jgi:hypothetical protein
MPKFNALIASLSLRKALMAACMLLLGMLLAACGSLPASERQALLDEQSQAIAEELQMQWHSHPLLQAYQRHLDQPVFSHETRELAGHLFVIVPGWLHQSNPSTGADLARQRAALQAMGASVYLANVQENASVEDNATRVLNDLQQLARSHDSIIVLSASKGGAEAALALTDISNYQYAPWTHRVRAWINIGGTLRGTALADRALDWRVCWLISSFAVPGGSMEGIRSLSTAQSVVRHASIKIAPHIQVVNLIGIAKVAEISARGKEGFAMLSDLGPNDGITLLRDAIYEAAPTVVLRGADHYFSLPDLDAHTKALAKALVQTLAASSQP